MKRFAWLAALLLASCRLAEIGAATINGQTTAANSPLTSLPAGGTATADPAQVASDKNARYSFTQINSALNAVLQYQGFTAANNWVYSFNSNNLPTGMSNPVGLGSNANFNVTTYSLRVGGAPPPPGFGETMNFTLQNGPANPTGPQGARVTAHWLQLVNESRTINGNQRFGTQVNGLPGWWALDNGFVKLNNQNPAAGPFYDSNAGGPQVFPPNFSDSPGYFSPRRTGTDYLHFVTIPTWDVNYKGKDYLLVGNDAVEWGFTITPEPSSLLLIGLGGGLLLVARLRRGRAGLPIP